MLNRHTSGTVDLEKPFGWLCRLTKNSNKDVNVRQKPCTTYQLVTHDKGGKTAPYCSNIV